MVLVADAPPPRRGLQAVLLRVLVEGEGVDAGNDPRGGDVVSSRIPRVAQRERQAALRTVAPIRMIPGIVGDEFEGDDEDEDE